MSAQGALEREEADREEYGGFVTGLELAKRRPVPIVAPVEAYILDPVMNLDRARAVWKDFLALKATLLADESCYDTIAGSKEMNRTGATRLATAFGLSLETLKVDEATPYDPTRNLADVRFQVRVRASRGARYADGIGSCRLSEIEEREKSGAIIPISKREHFALTRAATRAAKRAIADILGGTEAE